MASWLYFKGYGNYVPKIEDVQRKLVEMGDKPVSFQGSRNWIGSFEVSLFIDHEYGVRNSNVFFRFLVKLYI